MPTTYSFTITVDALANCGSVRVFEDDGVNDPVELTPGDISLDTVADEDALYLAAKSYAESVRDQRIADLAAADDIAAEQAAKQAKASAIKANTPTDPNILT